MPLKPKHPHDSRYTAPPPSSKVRGHELTVPYARTLDIVVHDELIERRLRPVTTFYAVDQTPLAVLRERYGPCERDGKRRRWYWLESAASAPQNLCYWATVLKFPDGGRLIVPPEGFLSEPPIRERLEREAHQELGHTPLIEFRRRTGLSRRHLLWICESVVAKNLADLRQSDFAPLFLAIDLVDINGGKGKERPVLVVVASDPRKGRRRLLGMFPMPKGGTKWSPQKRLVRQLKELLLALPHPEELLAVALDGEQRLHNLMRAVLDSAARQSPAFSKVRFVLDRWHVVFNAAKALAALRRSLRKEDPSDKATNLALKDASGLLEEEYWATVESDPGKLRQAKRLFRKFPELQDLHAIVTQVRDLFALEDRAAAAAALDALCVGLTELQCRRLDKFIGYVNEHREEFLTYFDMKAETLQRYGTAHSVTGGLVEAMNGEAKLRHVLARGAPLDVVHAQMILAFGEATASAREALEQEKARERLTPAERKAAEDFEADAEFFRTFPFLAKVDPPAEELPAEAQEEGGVSLRQAA